MEIGLGPGNFVLDGDPASPPKKEVRGPQFSADFYCGQTAKCIKMPLGMEVGLGSGHIVLDGDPAPAKEAQPPIFRPCLLLPNGWMDEDATWYGRRSRPRPHYVRRRPSSPPPRRGKAASLFDPCLLWPRSPISATAELLLTQSCTAIVCASACTLYVLVQGQLLNDCSIGVFCCMYCFVIVIVHDSI